MIAVLSESSTKGPGLEAGGYVASALIIANTLRTLIKEITPDVKAWIQAKAEAARLQREVVEAQASEAALQSEFRAQSGHREGLLLTHLEAQTEVLQQLAARGYPPPSMNGDGRGKN